MEVADAAMSACKLQEADCPEKEEGANAKDASTESLANNKSSLKKAGNGKRKKNIIFRDSPAGPSKNLVKAKSSKINKKLIKRSTSMSFIPAPEEELTSKASKLRIDKNFEDIRDQENKRMRNNPVKFVRDIEKRRSYYKENTTEKANA